VPVVEALRSSHQEKSRASTSPLLKPSSFVTQSLHPPPTPHRGSAGATLTLALCRSKAIMLYYVDNMKIYDSDRMYLQRV
jgi:hypothetical protein